MTTDKARKRAVRTRMQKTGERYAAARRHVARPDADPEAPPSGSPVDLPPRVAEPAMADPTVRRGTSRGWDEWFRILDAWGATERAHPEIARWLRDGQGVPAWWAQSVTVGYEYARGMRTRTEATPGRHQVSVRKTIAADPVTVWDAWMDPDVRGRWLEPDALRHRPGTGTAGKSARFDDPEGRLVQIQLQLQPTGRTTLTVTHEGLADRQAVERARAGWKARLGDLAALLGGAPASVSVARPTSPSS